MVDVTGHLGMALLFAAPAWAIWERRGALGFTAFTLLTAMLPDVDLVLSQYTPITHHGVTHTVLFVVLVSVLVGAVASRWLTDWLNANSWIRSETIARKTVFTFATAGMLVGGASHLFGDILSAPDIAAPLSPFWPVYSEPVIVDVIYYQNPWWNFGLFGVAIALHLLLARYDGVPLETRYRIGDPIGGEEAHAALSEREQRR